MYIVVQRNCPKEFLQHCVSHLNGHLSIDTLWHDQIFMTSLKCTLFMLQFCVPQNSSDLTTIFPPIVSAETSLLWKWKMWKFSYSFCVTVIFYFINWIVAAETIEGGKLFAEIHFQTHTYVINLISICDPFPTWKMVTLFMDDSKANPFSRIYTSLYGCVMYALLNRW